MNELRLILKCYQENVCTNHIYLVNVYKEDLPKWLTCHKTKPNKQNVMQGQFLSGV